jgi:hypothetical protein
MSDSLVTTRDITQIQNKFSFKPQQELVGYMNTFNTESQVVAIGSTASDVKSTGGKNMVINGQPIVAAADEIDISADTTEVTKTAWAGATAYVYNDIRWHKSKRIRCTLAHTSVTDANQTPEVPGNEPFKSGSWAGFWEVAPHAAVNASGKSITTLTDQWFVVTAMEDGQLSVWIAGDEVLTTTGARFEMPQVDPKTYCPVGILHIKNASASPFVVGTTLLSAASITDTFMQLTGGLLPMSDNWDSN